MSIVWDKRKHWAKIRTSVWRACHIPPLSLWTVAGPQSSLAYFVSISRIRRPSACTSAPSPAAALVWKPASCPGVTAPCRPCRGWRRGWGWGRPPPSCKQWPRWPTRTGPSSHRDPWSTGQLPHRAHFRGSAAGSELDAPFLSERKWNFTSTLNFQAQTHTPRTHSLSYLAKLNLTWACWVLRWGQLSKDYFPSDELVTRPRWPYPCWC